MNENDEDERKKWTNDTLVAYTHFNPNFIIIIIIIISSKKTCRRATTTMKMMMMM